MGDVLTPGRLFHYTCSHSIESIVKEGRLRPNPHQGFQPRATEIARQQGLDLDVVVLPVIWLTDVRVGDWSDVHKVGLESPFIPCNRVEYRVRVPSSGAVQWWPDWADRNVADDHWRALIELNCEPDRWWVSEIELTGCRLDESYRGPGKPDAN